MENTSFLSPKQKELFEFVKECHKGQFRKFTNDQVPYHIHPFQVARIIYNANNENFRHSVGIEVALLHDVLEDCEGVNTQEIMGKMVSLKYTIQQAKQTVEFCQELKNEFISADYPHLNRTDRKTKEACRLSQISSFAQSIKYADIDHNLQSFSILSEHNIDFLELTIKESVQKLDNMRKGDIHLAMQVGATLLTKQRNFEFYQETH